MFKMCLRRGKREPRDVIEERVGVELTRDLRQRKQAFQLRGECERFAARVVIKRFLSKMIACEHEPVFARVVNCKCEHAAQLAEHFQATLLVKMHEHFRVRVRGKCVTVFDE